MKQETSGNTGFVPQGRWRKLAGDLGVYAIGNLGAKVLTFLMVPLYTYFIPDTASFGYFAICLTAAFLLSPLVTLDLRDGVFRFLLDAPDEDSRRRVVTASAHLLGRSLAVALAVLLGKIRQRRSPVEYVITRRFSLPSVGNKTI